ncbi:MAG: hypothetical protein JJE48_02055 [Actinobacteria bacterium]|nr:hypothetical protein [Actinomycetota bacterium]
MDKKTDWSKVAVVAGACIVALALVAGVTVAVTLAADRGSCRSTSGSLTGRSQERCDMDAGCIGGRGDGLRCAVGQADCREECSDSTGSGTQGPCAGQGPCGTPR